MSTNKNTLKLYWEQVRKYKTSFFIMLITIPLEALLIDTLLPFYLGQAIGGLVGHNMPAIQSGMLFAAVTGTIGVTLNLIGFQAIARHEAHVRASLSDATFTRIINKDLQFFINEKVGALTSRFIDFIRSEVTLQDLLIIRTLGFVLSITIGLVILALHSLLVAIIVAALIGMLIVQVRWSIHKRAPLRHERKTLAGEINGAVADAVTNNLVVKTFAGEQVEIDTLATKNNRFRDVFIKDIGFLAYEGSARIALMTLAQIIAVGVATYLVFNGKMTVAIAIFILTYLQRVASQIFMLGDMLNGYDQALLEAAPMSDILSQETHINDAPGAVALPVASNIELQGVSYRYSPESANVLDAVSLAIPAGQKIGLVGHSGAGKTTITHLLLRFADVTGGSISIGGYDIRDVTQQSLRRAIAYVPQEPLLFHRSLRDNIAYGKPGASDPEIKDAARKANALEFIESLPQGLDTLVGERGIKLSGGQRQRIAIARAILKDAPILVLDEATSALDSESEKLIQDALETLMKDRTSIVIAHRLSTIAKLDRIIVLDSGHIIEDGTHNELLRKKGTYAKLWAHQSGGFIEE